MKELIEKMPENVRFQLEMLRKEYKNPALVKNEVRAEIRGYAKGLRDAGLVNDHQRGMLCIYCFN